MEQAILVAPDAERLNAARVSWVQSSFRQASFLCLALTVLLLPFPVRLPLVGGFGHYSLTALDAYPADFAALGAIAYGFIFTIYDLRFTKRGHRPQATGQSFTSRLRRRAKTELEFLIVNRKTQIANFLLVGWAFLSLLWSAEPLFGWLMMARLAGGLGLLLVAAHPTAEERRWLAGLLVLGGTFQGIIALWQFIRQEAVSLIYWPVLYSPAISGSSVVQVGPGRNFVLRAYGTLSHPNVLGGYLVIALTATLWLILQTKQIRGLWLWLLLSGAGVIIGGLVVSFSRAAWLSLGLSLLIGYREKLIRFKKPKFSFSWKKVVGLLIGLIAGILLLGLVAGPLSSRLFQLDLPLERNSLDERVNYFEAAFQLIGQHPMVGVGLSNFTVYSSSMAQVGPAWPFPVHNVSLLVIGELGLIGGVLWLLSWLAVLGRPGPEKVWATGVIALVIIGQFDHHPWTQPQSQMLWWLILGLWLGNIKRTRIEERGIKYG